MSSAIRVVPHDPSSPRIVRIQHVPPSIQVHLHAGSPPGLPLAALSVVDLAIWDLLGKIRGEPVYKMIGGRTKREIPLYLTGPRPEVAKSLGFWGGKVPLPYGPAEGLVGLRKNVAFLKEHKEKVGEDFPVMVDCWMSLNVVSSRATARGRIGGLERGAALGAVVLSPEYLTLCGPERGSLGRRTRLIWSRRVRRLASTSTGGRRCAISLNPLAWKASPLRAGSAPGRL